jgi:hypothetical protein
MNRASKDLLKSLLLLLLPVVGQAAPPPYWPGYPPSPYYYPPPAAVQSAPDETGSEPLHTKSVEAEPPQLSEDEVDTTAATSHEEIAAAKSTDETITDSTDAPTQKSQEEEQTTAIDAATHAENSLREALSREIALDIQQGNFAEAYYLWRPRAEAGDAEAQYGIGWMYHNGYGLAINDNEASSWWELAARQGHIDATFALGMLYGLGEGEVRRDMERAIGYYHSASRKGHEDARLLLHTLIQQGNPHAHQLMLTLLGEGRISEISTTEVASIISNKANVRRGGSTKHKVLTTLNKGHALFPLKRQGRWLLVGIAGRSYIGWIHDSLVGKDILTAK